MRRSGGAAAACSSSPTAPARPLLVFVPFTSADVPALTRGHELWKQTLPCAADSPIAQASRPGLLYLYNGRCGANESDSCGQVMRAVRGTAATSCFRSVLVRGAHLSGKEDRYDKQRRSAAWTAGPNNLFHRAAAKARRLGYWYMLQLEPDVLPLRAGWLDHVVCLTHLADAWVMGSALLANCTREETVTAHLPLISHLPTPHSPRPRARHPELPCLTPRRCAIQSGECVNELPEEFAEHINGNAVYAVGDDDFMRYVTGIRTGRLGRLPFDLALHAARQHFSQPNRRQLAHRFQHSSFVLNMGTQLPNVRALRASHPSSVLVHSSAFSKLGARPLQAVFDADAPSRLPSPPPRSSSASSPLQLNLEPLRRRAGVEKLALVAFVAGTRYRDLLRNFLLHLHRAAVHNYALVSLDIASTKHLEQAGEPVVDASAFVHLPPDGSDEFGSAAFFAVNGARYGALLTMLEAGYSLFVLDLDVAVLRNPLQWVRELSSATSPGQRQPSASHDLLIQSDARDGVSALEHDPDLVMRRLGMKDREGWAYANGGVFFCRATKSTVALFRGLWAELSAARTPPNEQDMLNRALATAKGTRWALLPARLFPNGFVFFYRSAIAPGGPVLVHCNWVNGVAEKIYHLREGGFWALPPPPELANRRFLSYGDGIDHGSGGIASICAHRRALRDALAIARALGRTLIVPQLPLLPGKSAPKSQVLSHFFDYSAFARQFPEHATREQIVQYASTTVQVHLDVLRGDDPPRGSGFQTIRTVANDRGSLGGTDRDIRRWLEPYREARVLHLWTPYRRFSGRLAKPADQKDFAVRVHLGLQLAPRLALLARFVFRALRKAVGRYDCIDISMSREFPASSDSAVTFPTAEALVRLAAKRVGNSKRNVLVVSDSPDDPLASSGVMQHLGKRAVRMDDYVPRWLVTDYDMPGSNRTSARALVELYVCAKAELFVGNVATPSTHAVCHQRHASRKSNLMSGKSGRAGCEDALGRHVLPPFF